MQKALKHEVYRQHNRLHPALIPKWNRNEKEVNKIKILKQVAKHKALMSDTTKMIMEEVINIDEISESLGFLGREAIM